MNRLTIAPGQACQLPTDVLVDVLWDMTPVEVLRLAADLARQAPEAFAELMLAKASDPALFAEQIARRRRYHARQSGEAITS